MNDPNDMMKKLLWAGHVGISMDGGKTIYGLTPHKPDHMSRKEFEIALRNNDAFDGVVGDDTRIFDLAREMAQKNGWNTWPERSIVLMDKPAQSAILAKVLEMKGMQPGEHGLGYQFPRLDANDGDAYHDSNGYAAECLANCAKFPEKVGVKIPEATGQMGRYMPELKKWIEADAPIDERKGDAP